MIDIPNYTILKLIYESSNSLIYQAQCHQDNRPVIFKLLKEDYPSPAELTRYLQEFDFLINLNLTGVIKAYELTKYQNSLVLVLEDFGGKSLAILAHIHHFSLAELLPLFIQVADSLGQVHAADLIHKDINSHNIVYNPTTGQVKLIDFGLATRLPRENPTLKSPNQLEGTLAYLSPEQTGRMNRTLDYRTDLYSLGVTFYELLTGQLPFVSADPLEIVHGHIAKRPVPVHKVNPQIPRIISDMVMKLMAKNAEDRYQSAFGLKYDLEQCLVNLTDLQDGSSFELAQQDISGKFYLPQKLYGREAEIEALWQAFDRVSSGTAELLLIAGYSGIGKTVLVQELYKPMTAKRGYFIAGKFDQFQRNIPYSAMVTAFRSLVQQLLTESAIQLANWQTKLLAALGPNGQVIVNVIPEVELIIGQPPAIPQLPTTEAQNRFNLVFQNFIKTFCAAEHPLVIFLDDLQWVDPASLKLLTVMMNDIPYLLVLGAYRDNEVTPTHPLMTTLAELQKTGVTLQTLTLSPLTWFHIIQFLADTLSLKADFASLVNPSPIGGGHGKVQGLAELLLEKTGGNPFFLGEFVKTLYTENLLQFDYQQQGWQWELTQIQASNITDNVIELMADKIQKLEKPTQQVLKLAASLGNQFESKMLALIAKQSPEETQQHLWEAVTKGLVLILQPDTYKFVHDRVQQSAYSLIAESERPALHWQIGQLLLNSIPILEEWLFEIVDHLNQGIALAETQTTKNQIAHLNLQTGQKAKLATAYGAALDYLQTGLTLLATDSWQTQYELTLALYTEAAETAYLCGQFEEMERLAAIVLQHARMLLDKVKVYEVKIAAYMVQPQPLAAIDTGLTILKLLGVSLPKRPNNLHIVLGLIETKLALRGKRIEDLGNLPTMTAADKLAAMRILSSILSATYTAVPNLLPLVVFKGIILSVKYGNTSSSPTMYVSYGMILCSILKNIDSGYRFGKLALNLLSRLNANEAKAKIALIFNCCIQHWQAHGQQTLPSLLEGYSSGIETGDSEYAAHCITMYFENAFFSGRDLVSVERETAKYSSAIKKLKHERGFQSINLNWQMILNLIKPVSNPCNLIGEVYDESTRLRLDIAANDENALFHLYFYKLILCYLFGEFQLALENAALTEKYLASGLGTMTATIFHFYDSLVKLAMYSATPKSQQRRLLRQVRANQKKIKQWAHYVPINYLHRFYLVAAEQYRVLGKELRAMDCYDKAIALAKKHQYLNEEALAHELAAQFYLEQGRETIAQIYLQNAHYCYLCWGATAKVTHLQTRYPQFLARKSSNTPSSWLSSSVSISTSGSQSLDLNSIIKASHTLSGEIVLQNLLEKMMNIVIENAGAEEGFLLLPKQGQWFIEAEGALGQQAVTILQSLPINDNWLVSAAIVHYVVRTQQPLALNAATKEGVFTQDIHIVRFQVKSVLCLPLKHQGQLTGVLYLENNLITGAFTPERLEILNLLSSQLAISLENALLYANLEQKVVERTRELSQAHQEVENLLLNILPAPIAHRLKAGETMITDAFAEVTVLFADIVGFTKLSMQLSPDALVAQLNLIFCEFDALADKYGLEKIKTIGDCYMVVAGIPFPCANHAQLIANMALEMHEVIQRHNAVNQDDLQMRIGIHSGPVIAGVIGKRKFAYDLWGDTVNTASRMESHGIPGETQVTEVTYQLLKDYYLLESRPATLLVKGKGEMQTYLLKRKKLTEYRAP
jgi:predicted ATPase/class 3 adenylate cyclase